MTESHTDDEHGPGRAARWVARFNSAEGLSEAEQQAFNTWIMASAQNLEAFAVATAHDDEAVRRLEPTRVCTLDELIDVVCRPSPDEVKRLLAPDEGSELNVEPEELFSNRDPCERAPPAGVVRQGHRRLPRPLQLAIAALFLIGLPVIATLQWMGAGQTSDSSGWRVYDANVGHVRWVTLEDQSLLTLNPETVVHVRFSDELREVDFVRGICSFAPEHDHARPFVVKTVYGTVRATGTRFAVSLLSGQAIVSVSEGKVVITGNKPGDSVEIGPQETGVLNSEGPAKRVGPEQASANAPPGAVRLTHFEDTLVEVTAAFNARHPTPRFIVEGEARERRISVSLNLDDPESLMNLLRGIHDLRLTPRGDSIVIRQSRDRTPGRAKK